MRKALLSKIFGHSVLPVFLIVIISAVWVLSADYTKIFFSLMTIAVSYWFHKIITVVLGWYRENIALKTKTKLDDEFIPLFNRLLKILIWCIALITILGKFGVNINALITALGVGSLAIALAAQDTIANIISGFLIMIDRPFIIGDTIKLPTAEKVKVLDIGIRRSKFLAEDNAIVIVPNVDLSKSKIINYSQK